MYFYSKFCHVPLSSHIGTVNSIGESLHVGLILLFRQICAGLDHGQCLKTWLLKFSAVIRLFWVPGALNSLHQPDLWWTSVFLPGIRNFYDCGWSHRQRGACTTSSQQRPWTESLAGFSGQKHCIHVPVFSCWSQEQVLCGILWEGGLSILSLDSSSHCHCGFPLAGPVGHPFTVINHNCEDNCLWVQWVPPANYQNFLGIMTKGRTNYILACYFS